MGDAYDRSARNLHVMQNQLDNSSREQSVQSNQPSGRKPKTDGVSPRAFANHSTYLKN